MEETIGDVGDGRLLIAAGLSLVDDLEAAQSMMDKHEIDDLDNRITLIERSAAAALSDAAGRINAISSALMRRDEIVPLISERPQLYFHYPIRVREACNFKDGACWKISCSSVPKNWIYPSMKPAKSANQSLGATR